MTYEAQRFTAPDGTPLVVITEEEYRRLSARPSDEAAMIAELDAELAAHRARGDGVPGEVMTLLLEGNTPVGAWRRYRGMTQAALAEATGLSQPAINALDQQPDRIPHFPNRRKLAEALGTTLASLDACWN